MKEGLEDGPESPRHKRKYGKKNNSGTAKLNMGKSSGEAYREELGGPLLDVGRAFPSFSFPIFLFIGHLSVTAEGRPRPRYGLLIIPSPLE